MKFRHILPILAMVSPLASLAVPAYPGLLTVKNPDGVAVQIKLHGDEYFSYATDAEGKLIYERNIDGAWQVAQRNGVVLTATAENIEMLRAEEMSIPGRQQMFDLNNGQGRYARLGPDERSMFPCSGEGDFLVILLAYRNTPFSMEDPQAFYTRWFNEKDFTYGDLKGSARDYYMSVSGGKFKPNFVVAPVVTLPKSSSFYVGSNKYANFAAAISTAVQTLDQQGFDFSRFDMDNDGKIDNIYFIYAGYGQADTGDTETIWPHKSSMENYRITLDGKLLTAYACSNELRGSAHYYNKDGVKAGIGTFCHEFGHVLGLPDLYDPAYSVSTEAQIPGDWSLMCNGPYLNDGITPAGFSAYDRWVCRWMEFEEMKGGNTYTLNPLSEEMKAYRLNVPTTDGGSEFFIFESRSKTGYDAYLPGNGMLIWHVDYDEGIWNQNRVNSTAGRPRCSVVIPDGMNVARSMWPSGSTIYGQCISPGLPNELKPFRNYNASMFTPTISDISYDANTRQSTFKYKDDAVAFDGVINDVKVWRNDEQKGFNVDWTPVQGATGYIVTVKRYNSTGASFIVDNYENKLISGTSIVIREDLPLMNQQHIVSVRAYGDLPSTRLYETEKFVPATLGVGEVGFENAEMVYGTRGGIVAPEGSQIYTLAGMQVTAEQLPAGIYLVRTPSGKTVKVVVR